MNNLSALILEDEPLARNRMRTLLEKCGLNVIHEVGDATDAIDWISKNMVDVILVDIGLPEISGVEFVRKLRKKNSSQNIIFTTAYDNYAIDAFDMKAVDYLLKPVRLERLKQALERITPKHNPQPEFTHFTVRSRNQIKLIALSDARYLKAEAKYVTLVTHDQREYLLSDTLVNLEESLGKNLLRIHRSILVMRHAIIALERIDGDSGDWGLQLKNIDMLLPISRRQLASLRAALEEKYG